MIRTDCIRCLVPDILHASCELFASLQLVPSKEGFLEKLGTPNEELYQQMAAFLNAFQPILQDIHSFFVEHDLDDPARV